MSTFGIGTDICDIRRIREPYARRGERFARRILGPREWQIWQARMARSPERGLRFLATRFSAKEAFSKAIGLGLHAPMTWQRCEITNLPSGQPVVNCHGPLAQWMAERGLQAKVSLSDESDYAVSFVIVETPT